MERDANAEPLTTSELPAETKTALELQEPTLRELRQRFAENANTLDLDVRQVIRDELNQIKCKAWLESDLIFDRRIVDRWLKVNGHEGHMDHLEVSHILRAEIYNSGLQATNLYCGPKIHMRLLTEEEEAES